MNDNEGRGLYIAAAGTVGSALPLGLAFLLSLQVGCAQPVPPQKHGDKSMAITVTSSAFDAGQPIPARHTGDGEDRSPPLSWSGLPEDTKQLALVCDDPDAPSAEAWVHWVIYHLPGDLTSLPEAVPAQPSLDQPAGALHECRAMAIRLLAEGWHRYPGKCFPQASPEPAEDLRAIRLLPPESDAYYIELLRLQSTA